MTTANALIDKHPQIFDLDYLQQEMSVEWTEEDARQLRLALDPYIDWIQTFLGSCDSSRRTSKTPARSPSPSANDEPRRTLRHARPRRELQLREYEEFWVTVHYPNPEPVVTLLPKVLPGAPEKVLELCAKCAMRWA